jgi:hypothetical protein
MYALRRILIAFLLFWILLFGAFGLTFDITAHWPDLPPDRDRTLAGFGLFAVLIFIVGYLVTPLFRRGRVEKEKRPWRVLVLAIGAVLIIWIIGILMRSVDTLLWQPFPAQGGLGNQQVWIFDLVLTLLSLIGAAAYVRYPIPRSLR